MKTTNSIHTHILQMIKGGKLKQRPKWYYALSMLAVMGGLLSLFLILLYLVSFVSLVLHEHLLFEAFAFGPKTVFDILYMVPPFLVILVLVVLLLLHLVVRHFAFAYMRPVLVTLGIGLAITLIIFSSILFFDKDSRIARLGERHRGMAMFRDEFRDRKPPKTVRGTIIEEHDDIYSLQGDKGTTTLKIDTLTRKDREVYMVGDSIVALAVPQGSLLRALAVRIDDGTFSFPRPMMHP